MHVYLFEGKGPVIPLVVVAVVGGADYLWSQMRTEAIADYGNLVNLGALLLAAIVLYVLGKRLAATCRTLQDPATGEQVIVRERHAFLGGSADTWAYVLGAFAIYALAHGAYTGTLFSTF
ncbi:MAG: hypothetical protein HYS20_04740 [Rhodocyclales bacterium]|nr:hypothetical protein [Rhodocyclales bacterium]